MVITAVFYLWQTPRDWDWAGLQIPFLCALTNYLAAGVFLPGVALGSTSSSPLNVIQ